MAGREEKSFNPIERKRAKTMMGYKE